MGRSLTASGTSISAAGSPVRVANDYARRIVAGKLPACRQIRQACERHLADLARARADQEFPFYFDPTAVNHFYRFYHLLPFIEGEQAARGEHFMMPPWLTWVVACLFGWRRRTDGSRRYRRLFFSVGRKNTKSTFAAIVGLYLLAADNEAGAKIFAVAKSQKQAEIVWSYAKAMVEKSPQFQVRYGVRPLSEVIVIESNYSSFVSLPGNPGDGTNPHGGIVDEYHEHNTSRALDAIYTGMGARRQPLLLITTTAGYNLSSPCYRLQDYCEKVLAGQIRDDSLLPIIYTLDADDEWHDPKAWVKANPNLGISVSRDQLLEACNEALHDPAKQNIFKTKRCNLWGNAGTGLLNMTNWAKCANPSLNISDYWGKSCYLGVDLAYTTDLCALAMLFPPEERGGEWAVFMRFWLPEAALNKPANEALKAWELDGWIMSTPGNVTDYAMIVDEINECRRQYNVLSIAVDQYQAVQLTTQLSSDNAPVVLAAMNVMTLSPATKELIALIESGKLRHRGDPVLTWNAGNVVGVFDNKDNVYPRKTVRENKIDGIIALLLALWRAMLQASDSNASAYEIRDLTII